MASPNQIYGTNGPSLDTGEHQRLYRISIDTSAMNSTATSDASGAVTPATWKDFASFPASTNNSKRMARGNIRYRRMLEKLGTYTNFKILKLQSDSSEDQDTQITSLQFTLEFENDSHIPSSGTSIDGSTSVSTREAVIKELIAEALFRSYTEVASVYNSTAGRGQENVSLTASAVLAAGEILEAITVTRQGDYDMAGDAEVVTSNA